MEKLYTKMPYLNLLNHNSVESIAHIFKDYGYSTTPNIKSFSVVESILFLISSIIKLSLYQKFSFLWIPIRNFKLFKFKHYYISKI